MNAYLSWLMIWAYVYKHCNNLIFFMDYFGYLIEINKVSNEQSQYVCKIEREVGGFKGRQVWKNPKSKTLKFCWI